MRFFGHLPERKRFFYLLWLIQYLLAIELSCFVNGRPSAQKIDVFLENFQTALTPPIPPRPFMEITLHFFPENPLSLRKFAIKFFGLEMTPPFPSFLDIFSKIYDQKIEF